MLQNRVDPWGNLHAVADRGTYMGNRGILHNSERNIVRQWKHTAWVTCLLEYGNLSRPRPLFSSLNDYSELFFLDEATAFAAGHRPCHFCQRKRAAEFKDAWRKANASGTDFVSMKLLDDTLHKERVQDNKSKATFDAQVGELPQGTMFSVGGQPFLVSERGILPWSFAGYGAAQHFERTDVVAVLTPPSVVKAFREGYKPQIHITGTQ